MKKLSFILASVLMIVGNFSLRSSAATLTPEAALAAARSQSTALSGPMRQKAADMTLAYRMEGTVGPTVYVFTPAGSDATGFMIVSADDTARPLLGYSDESTFDPANIPPQLQWMLSCYNSTIEAIAADPAATAAMRLSRESSSATRLRAPQGKIAPLCATKWNQDKPYNNSCPIVGGSRSVTGCVATAMAQVMKVHQWPQQGTGSHTYQFSYNGATYQDSFNYGSTTFNWSKMQNTYTSTNYTTSSANAVATLMHACGVAADMEYSPDASGASEYDAASGMIEYLGYDAAMTVESRYWYTASAWDSLIYGELSAGRPVLYCGNDQTSGHAFVCDGYDGNSYFHINWGWSGTADGYFLLADLNPYTQGIGGGSGEQGFNWGQTALIGTKPAVSGSTRPMVMGTTGDITVDAASYPRNSSSTMYIGSSDGFYNYSTYTLTNFYIGLILEGNGGRQYVTIYTLDELRLLHGYTRLGLKTSKLPEGTWKAYLAVSPDGTNWTPMRYNPTLTDGYINLEVTSTTVKASVAAPGSGSSSVDITMTGTTAANGVVPGSTYTFDYSFQSSSSFSQEYVMILANMTDMVAEETGTSKTVSSSGSKVSAQFSLTIPSDLDRSKDYAACLCVRSDNGYTIVDRYDVSIVDATVTYDIYSYSPREDEFYAGTDYTFTFEFTTTGPISETYYAIIVAPDAKTIVCESDGKLIKTSGAETKYGSFTLSIPTTVEYGKDYVLYLATLSDNTYYPVKGWYIDFAERPHSTLTSIVSTEDAAAELYDLQGRRVVNPTPGKIYIKRSAAGTSKIIFKR